MNLTEAIKYLTINGYALNERKTFKIDWNEFDDDVKLGVELCKKIEAYNYEAYIVGGCVRDIVQWYNDGCNGKPNVHDIDIATNMPIEELYANFKCASNNGEEHGTIIVIYKGESFEVTQFRADGAYTDGRHPDSVMFTKSFKDDTDRRDFTINAMGIDCRGNLIDYHNGADDLYNKVLRTVGEPKERFSEDALRIIRAMRFAARFGMDIDPKTMDAINELSGSLSKVARERIGAELLKTAEYGHTAFKDVIGLLIKSSANNAIDPSNIINWRNAIELVTKNESDDKGVMMACLFTGIKNIKPAIDLFRLDNNLLKTLQFIYSNIDVIEDPFKDLAKTVKAVTNKSFNSLNEYAYLLTGKSLSYSDIEDFQILANKVLPKSKSLTKAITIAGYAGPDFGKALAKVNNWYYNKTFKGKQPSDVDIAEYIDTLKIK